MKINTEKIVKFFSKLIDNSEVINYEFNSNLPLPSREENYYVQYTIPKISVLGFLAIVILLLLTYFELSKFFAILQLIFFLFIFLYPLYKIRKYEPKLIVSIIGIQSNGEKYYWKYFTTPIKFIYEFDEGDKMTMLSFKYFQEEIKIRLSEEKDNSIVEQMHMIYCYFNGKFKD